MRLCLLFVVMIHRLSLFRHLTILLLLVVCCLFHIVKALKKLFSLQSVGLLLPIRQVLHRLKYGLEQPLIKIPALLVHNSLILKQLLSVILVPVCSILKQVSVISFLIINADIIILPLNIMRVLLFG